MAVTSAMKKPKKKRGVLSLLPKSDFPWVMTRMRDDVFFTNEQSFPIILREGKLFWLKDQCPSQEAFALFPLMGPHQSVSIH